MRRAQITVSPSSNLQELQQKVQELKKKLNAVIVAHNYQRPEVQDIADFVGDSLELARRCAEIEAEIIVFCGVRFMAETAAILNPSRRVLLSHPTAGCPLADMITVEDVRDWKASYPQATVVAYVNTTAAIKAESDILRRANPGKSFHLIASSLICPDMKKTRLETVIETMELKQNVVTVPEGIRPKAKQAIDRMLAIA